MYSPRQVEYFLKLATIELSSEFAQPNLQDEQDLKILMRRALNALNKSDIPLAVKALKSVDNDVRSFKHENFDEDFYDFVSDQDIWGKVYQIASPPSATDLTFLEAMKELLNYFQDQKLFK